MPFFDKRRMVLDRGTLEYSREQCINRLANIEIKASYKDAHRPP